MSDPATFPFAILAKRPGESEVELYAGVFPGTNANWRARAEELRHTGCYEWVRWVTMGCMDEETGEFLDHRSRPRP